MRCVQSRRGLYLGALEPCCPLWPSATTVTALFDGAAALGRQQPHGPHSAPCVSSKQNEIVTRKFMSLARCSKYEPCFCLKIHHSQCDDYFYSQLFEPAAPPAWERHIRSQKVWMYDAAVDRKLISGAKCNIPRCDFGTLSSASVMAESHTKQTNERA